MSDEKLKEFATRYAVAWCSQDPEKVAALNDGLIGESKGNFDAADYERQLSQK